MKTDRRWFLNIDAKAERVLGSFCQRSAIEHEPFCKGDYRHMMRSKCSLLAVAVVLIGCTTASAQKFQPPVSNGKPVFEQEAFPAVETSLSQMWDNADAVVEITIVSNEVHGFGQKPYVTTLHTSRVVRVLKGTPKPNSVIVFAESAGQLELPDKIIRAGDIEPMDAGQRYVVFLRWWKAFDVWSGDRFHAFKIREGHVEPQGYGRVADDHQNLSERQFLDELQHFAQSKPKV
jgi:hypothetical protein